MDICYIYYFFMFVFFLFPKVTLNMNGCRYYLLGGTLVIYVIGYPFVTMLVVMFCTGFRCPGGLLMIFVFRDHLVIAPVPVFITGFFFVSGPVVIFTIGYRMPSGNLDMIGVPYYLGFALLRCFAGMLFVPAGCCGRLCLYLKSPPPVAQANVRATFYKSPPPGGTDSLRVKLSRRAEPRRAGSC